MVPSSHIRTPDGLFHANPAVPPIEASQQGIGRPGEKLRRVMNRLYTLASIAAVVVALVLLPCAAEVTVERITYHGWADSWRMSNGAIDLVVVPRIGRIMRYGRVGGPNMLWENPDTIGKAADLGAKGLAEFRGGQGLAGAAVAFGLAAGHRN